MLKFESKGIRPEIKTAELQRVNSILDVGRKATVCKEVGQRAHLKVQMHSFI